MHNDDIQLDEVRGGKGSARRPRLATGAALGRALVTGALVTSLTLSPVLACPIAAFADEGSAGTSSVKKDETVYIKTDAAGTVEGAYVVNLFDSDSDATVTDAAAYDKVVNLTDTQKLEQKGGAVKLKVTGDEPFYYQGNLSKKTELPWDISVTYRLDGKKVSADELAGATGDIEIELAVTAKTDGSEDVSDFANSCVLQAQGTFDEDSFKLTDAGGATEAHVGNSTTLSAMVLPGESETFTIKGEARDFEYDGWQVAAMPLSMAIDLSSASGELTDKTGELSDATAQIAGGSESLTNALTTIDSGASTLATGASSAASGASSVAAGAQSVSAGAQQLNSGVVSLASALGQASGSSQELRDGAAGVVSGAAQVGAGVDTYIATLQGSKQQLPITVDEAQANYQAAMTALAQDAAAGTFSQADVDAVNNAVTVLAQVSGGAGANQALDQAAAGAQQLASGASDLSAGAAALQTGVNSYTGAVDSMASAASAATPGAQALADGAASLSTGADQLASGTSQVASGAQQLSSGTAQAKDGSATLSDGAQELADATANLGDEIIDQVQEKIDEKLGAGYETHSFVAPENTDVDRVQFVYMIDGVTKPEAKKESKSESKDQTPLDRLLALFQ